jgi:RinA family phage transcriptional activator
LRLNKAVFRFVEHELYNYDLTKGELEELREDIISGTPARDDLMTTVQTGRISNPTAARGEKLVTSKVLTRMARTVTAIERALEKMDEQHQILFELKYRQGLHYMRVCDTIPTSVSSYFRMREKLVYAVALEMGHL